MMTNIHFWSYLGHFFSEWEIFWTECCRDNQNTHFLFNNLFPPDNRAVCEIMWKNIIESGRPQVTTWLMRIARWIPKSTNTRSEFGSLCSVRIRVFLTQQHCYPWWIGGIIVTDLKIVSNQGNLSCCTYVATCELRPSHMEWTFPERDANILLYMLMCVTVWLFQYILYCFTYSQIVLVHGGIWESGAIPQLIINPSTR